MMKSKIIVYSGVFAFVFLWSYGGFSRLEALKQHFSALGLSPALANWTLIILPLFLFLILFVEIGLKAILLEVAFTPPKFIPTDAEACTYINQDDLRRYTAELETMGFIQLTDYSSQEGRVTSRLFAHPDHFYFAEVEQQDAVSSSALCSIVSLLDKEWAMVVSNAPVPAISNVFCHHPQVLVKNKESTSITILVQSLVAWREKVCSDVRVSPMQVMNAEAYFEFAHHKNIELRQRFLHTSMIWTLLKMQYLMIKPKSEWLGDYRQFRKPHS